MKFFDKAYVGFQRSRYSSSDEPRILGFLVPEGTTKAELKRKQTVDGWRQKDIEPRIIDNTPQRGFKLAEVVSRYSTSNKLFRVVDPRGFELEITADNLLDLATHGSIIRGEIVEECVWVTAGNLTLLPVTDPRYTRHNSNTLVDVKATDAGKYFMTPGNLVSLFRFEGMFDILELRTSYEATDYKTKSTYSNFYDRDEYVVNSYEGIGTIKRRRVCVYTEFFLDDNGEVSQNKTKTVHVRTSHLKKMTEVKAVPLGASSFKLPMEKIQETNKYGQSSLYCTNGVNGDYFALFPDKESSMSFDLENFRQHIKPTRYTSYLEIPGVSIGRYSTILSLSAQAPMVSTRLVDERV